jgi:hypothetical protein
MSDARPVFYVSDGTGITAETIGHSLLTQFAETRFVTDRIPFVDTAEKAIEAATKIRRTGEEHGARPIVVNSSIDPELNALLAGSGALMLDVFAPFIEPLEKQGLIFAGMSPDGLLPEIVERPDHPWFVGVQFHPELKSRPFDPHPLFAGFIAAALEQSRLV